MRVTIASCLFLAVLAAMSCTWQTRLSHVPIGPAILPVAEPQPRKLIILMYGVYNSENSEKFDPEWLGIVGLDLPQAHATIAEKARALIGQGPTHVPSWAESDKILDRPYSKREQDLLWSRLRQALDVLDATVHTHRIPIEQVTKIKAPFIPPKGWSSADRILMVVGLETVRRPNPLSKGLISVLGCFWFSGDTSYLGVIVVPFDFYNWTAELGATASENCFQFSRDK